MELQGFYNHETDSSLSGGQSESSQHLKSGSPFLLHPATKPPITPTLKFHNHFPQDADKKEGLLDSNITSDGSVFSPPLKRTKIMSGPGSAGPPPLNERVMLYVRQESEDVYTPLHVVPPTTVGLLNAVRDFSIYYYFILLICLALLLCFPRFNILHAGSKTQSSHPYFAQPLYWAFLNPHVLFLFCL